MSYEHGAPKKMPFGKYKGQQIEDIPSDYIHWALENIEDLYPDLKEEFENQLALREGKGVVRREATEVVQYFVIDKSTDPSTIYGPYGSKEKAASAIIKLSLKNASITESKV